MPNYRRIPQDERWHIVNYVRQLQIQAGNDPAAVQAAQAPAQAPDDAPQPEDQAPQPDNDAPQPDNDAPQPDNDGEDG